MSKRPRLVVRKAKNDEKSFSEIVDMLLALHAENGVLPFDPAKATEIAYRVLEEGMTFVARMGGKPVGTIALTEAAPWYSPNTVLHDVWFWVSPEHRARDVGVKLLRAAREEAEARGKLAFVTITDPDRRQKKTPATLVSQIAGYVPLGFTLKVH